MTNYSLSRRRMLAFAGTAFSTSALAGTAPSLESLLLGATGETRVRQILKKHFKLESSHDSVVKEFFFSLATSNRHTENTGFFQEHLDDKALAERCEIYVIEQFVVSTNFLSLPEGELKELRMLPG